MRTLSLALAVVGIWALTGAAHSLTFEEAFIEGWAEQHGPQFLVPLSTEDVLTVWRALGNLELTHEKLPDGITVYEMGRRARILEKLAHPSFYMYGMLWDIDLVDADGKIWQVQQLTLPEMTLLGFAVSRDRYCRAEDQDVDDAFEAGAYCAYANGAAIALYERIANSRHMTPGGAR